jgi:TRAP-type uncharacterized transport system fused permease subunit
LASLAAASISEGNYNTTSWQAFKLSIPNFIMPFLIVYNPAFLLRPGASLVLGSLSILSAMAALVCLNSFVYNHLKNQMARIERLGILLAAALFFGCSFTAEPVWLIPAIIIAGITAMKHVFRSHQKEVVLT